MDDDLTALLWAAGSQQVQFHIQPRSYEWLLHLTDVHRLSGRFLRRLLRERPPGYRRLLPLVSDRHQITKRRLQDQLHLCRTIGEALRRNDIEGSPILLKGHTLYTLTGDPFNIRRSGDLDVITSDLDGFLQAMLRSGYEVVGELNQLAEYAVLVDQDMNEIELHSRFDVTSLASDGSRSMLDPTLNPRQWHLRTHFAVKYITYPDLRECLEPQPRVVSPIAPVRPEMAALIHAAHMYKDHLRYPYPLRIGTLRLDEVATFHDLLQLPSFDKTIFARLVERFSGTDAVQFAEALAATLLGTPSQVAEFEARSHPFPINLWWDGMDGGGFPVQTAWRPTELAVRTAPFHELTERLGANHLNLGDSIRILPARQQAQTSRIIYRVDPTNNFTVDVTMHRWGDGLALTCDLSYVRPDAMVGFSFYLQDFRYELFTKDGETLRFSNYSWHENRCKPASVHISPTEIGYSVEFQLGQSVVDSLMRNSHQILPCLLIVREQLTPWRRMTAGAAVALHFNVHQESVPLCCY